MPIVETDVWGRVCRQEAEAPAGQAVVRHASIATAQLHSNGASENFRREFHEASGPNLPRLRTNPLAFSEERHWTFGPIVRLTVSGTFWLHLAEEAPGLVPPPDGGQCGAMAAGTAALIGQCGAISVWPNKVGLHS